MPKSKGVKTPPPDSIGELESTRIALWARQEYRGLTGQEIREFIEECLDWHRANGIWRVEWPATCRNWIRNGVRFKRDRTRIQQQEKPKPRTPPNAFAQVESLLDRIGKRI